MTSTTTFDESRLTTEIAQLWPPQGQWTETDYFNLPDTNRIIELSEGEIILTPPPSFTHQKVLDNLYSALKAYVQSQKSSVTAFAPLASWFLPKNRANESIARHFLRFRPSLQTLLNPINDLTD